MVAALHSLPAPLQSTKGVLTHSREWIPGGNAGTAATVRRMRDLVTLGKRDFAVRKVLQHILQECPHKDYYCFAKSIFEFCRDRIRYVFDPNGVELIESPRKILEAGVADCDSICVLVATLFEQAGFETNFVTIKADSTRPKEYSHVYVRVKVPGHGWLGADCTMKNPFGWEPPKKYERKYWPGSKDKGEVREGDAMAGLAEGSIPGMQEMWDAASGFVNEPSSLVISSPETLELSQREGAPIEDLPAGSGDNVFFLPSNAPEVFPKDYLQEAAGEVTEISFKANRKLMGLLIIGFAAWVLLR